MAFHPPYLDLQSTSDASATKNVAGIPNSYSLHLGKGRKYEA